MTDYLSGEEVLRLHFQVIEDYGGSHGVRDEGGVHSVVNAPQQVLFGFDQYPELTTKSAVYLRNIISDHPFVDGNKPTALVVCGIFLHRNGYDLRSKPKELENFVVSIAVDHLSIDEISAWLSAHVLPAN